jgi:signal transduction histidine kinase
MEGLSSFLLEEHPQVFERFVRGQVGRESGEPGTGLGLPLAQEIRGAAPGPY